MTVLEINTDPSFVTWELCNWSSVSDLSVITSWLPDASWCFEMYFFKLQCISENITFLSFLYVLLSCSYFLLFSVFLPSSLVKPSQCLSLLPSAPSACPSFLLPLPSQMYVFNSWSKLRKTIFSLSTCRVKMARHWSDQNWCHQQL